MAIDLDDGAAETVSSGMELLREYHAKDVPVWLSGPPGVGKSSMPRQLCDSLNIGFKDIRLAQMDPVDLRGLPTTTEVESAIQTIWAKPDFWPDPKKDGPKGIILFDELSDTGRAMQSAAYQIILDRRAGPHIIPPGWYPMAAGNRRGDKAAAQMVSSALATRFAWITIKPDVDSFREWGINNGIHPFVMGYLKAFPKHLWSDEGAESETFACPRQWAQVSKFCNSNPRIRQRLVRGLVGRGIAGQFEAAIKTFKLPSLEDVIKDPRRCPIPGQPAEKYAMSTMLAQYANRKNFDKLMQYAERPEFGKDFCTCFALDVTSRDSSLCDTDAFSRFAAKNAHMKL